MTFRHSIFQIRPETWPDRYGTHARDQAVERIIETIDASTFPWRRCIPALRNSNIFPYPIEFMEPLDGALGYVSSRRMWLRPSATNMPTYHTIAHELAHLADCATLGSAFDAPRFNATASPWRQMLIETATWNGHVEPPSRSWLPMGLVKAAWHERPVEAVTVPFTRAFWNNPKFYYNENPFAQTWTWADVKLVRDIFLIRSLPMFSDVPKDHTHAEAIEHLTELGIIGGYTNGTYRPQDSVTRGQLASIIAKTIQHLANR